MSAQTKQSGRNDGHYVGRKKFTAISLSNSTVQRKNSDMTVAIENQAVQKIKSAKFGLFSIQLDELTDVSVCSQLLVLQSIFIHLKRFLL